MSRHPVLADRVWRVRRHATFAVQSGVAAAVAWFVAHDVVRHPQPFFAPIAAVIVLGTGTGMRLRRALELVAGVALGIGLGDALVYLVGVGVGQIAVVVTLAILATVVLGGGDLALAQAAASAVLVVTLAPSNGELNLGRIVDALVGGSVGLGVMALVLPTNPLARVRRAADLVLTQLADSVLLTARGLREAQPALARRALADLRGAEGQHTDLLESLELGREAATLSPLQWRTRRALGHYLDAAVHVERATRNVRVLARRGAAVVTDGEPLPGELPAALDALALAVRTLREELAAGREPTVARERLLGAVRIAGDAYQAGVGFSGSVAVAQLRGAVVDLLRGTGLSEGRADWLVADVRTGQSAQRAPGG